MFLLVNRQLGIKDFYGSSGRVKPANFCGDTRVLPYLRGTVFSAVAIEAEPEGDNQRSMILVLPNDGYTVDESIAELADKYATKTVQWFSGADVELRGRPPPARPSPLVPVHRL